MNPKIPQKYRDQALAFMLRWSICGAAGAMDAIADKLARADEKVEIHQARRAERQTMNDKIGIVTGAEILAHYRRLVKRYEREVRAKECTIDQARKLAREVERLRDELRRITIERVSK